MQNIDVSSKELYRIHFLLVHLVKCVTDAMNLEKNFAIDVLTVTDVTARCVECLAGYITYFHLFEM